MNNPITRDDAISYLTSNGLHISEDQIEQAFLYLQHRVRSEKKSYDDEISNFFSEGKFYSLNEAKKWNRCLGHSIKRLMPEDEKRINRVFSCGNSVGIVYSPSLHKSHTMSFWCDERACPVCNYYKSRSLFSRIYNYVRSNSDRRYVFLTLTVRNVSYADLRETVKRMNRAFGRMFPLAVPDSKASKMFTGYLKRLEVTYNIDPSSDSYRTFHPHFHVLLETSPNYKVGTSCFYHKSDILKDWQYYYGDPTITQVDICEIQPDVDPKGYEHGLAKAVAEVAKYPMKFSKKLCVPENQFLLDEYVAGIFSLKGCIFESASKNFKQILHFVSKPVDDDPLPEVVSSPDATFVGAVYCLKEKKYIYTSPILFSYRDKFGFDPLTIFKSWSDNVRLYDLDVIKDLPNFL